jgi:very-short-patch-repair endonuclease
MSLLEDQFLGLWQSRYPDLPLVREYSDIPTWEADFQERYAKSKRSKRYRADFAHIPSRSIVEIQGGTFNGGRHVRASGYERDCRKFNLATMGGWKVFLLTTQTAKETFWLERIAASLRTA